MKNIVAILMLISAASSYSYAAEKLVEPSKAGIQQIRCANPSLMRLGE